MRPGLLVDLPCSAPLRPGAAPVPPDEGADVVAVPLAALGAVVGGRWSVAPDVPGCDVGDGFEPASAADRRSRVERGTLSPPRDVSRCPGLAPSAVDAAEPRSSGEWAAPLAAAAASIRAGSAGGEDRG